MYAPCPARSAPRFRRRPSRRASPASSRGRRWRRRGRRRRGSGTSWARRAGRCGETCAETCGAGTRREKCAGTRRVTRGETCARRSAACWRPRRRRRPTHVSSRAAPGPCGSSRTAWARPWAGPSLRRGPTWACVADRDSNLRNNGESCSEHDVVTAPRVP